MKFVRQDIISHFVLMFTKCVELKELFCVKL